jgi:hypothetical protein
MHIRPTAHTTTHAHAHEKFEENKGSKANEQRLTVKMEEQAGACSPWQLFTSTAVGGVAFFILGTVGNLRRAPLPLLLNVLLNLNRTPPSFFAFIACPSSQAPSLLFSSFHPLHHREIE